jgi:DNA-binding transcriptional LysR family regulator
MLVQQVDPVSAQTLQRGFRDIADMRLLARATRCVAPTEAGERLLRTIGPAFAKIEGRVAALSELRDKPASGR